MVDKLIYTTNQPVSPNLGEIWYNTNINQLCMFTDNGWVTISVELYPTFVCYEENGKFIVDVSRHSKNEIEVFKSYCDQTFKKGTWEYDKRYIIFDYESNRTIFLLKYAK